MIKQSLFAASGLLLAFMSTNTYSHGSTEYPVSRNYQCYQEGPGSLDSAACQAAAAKSGTAMLYDWMSFNQLPNGDHKAFVSDGLLCSAGSSSKSGMDLARSDWVKTPITTGTNSFTFYATAPHATYYFRWYITKQGWNQNQPLTWDSLELIAETGVNSGRVSRHTANVNVPSDRSGYHVVYNVWQRSDSAEAFYACSDVVIGVDNSTSTGNGSSTESGSDTDTDTGNTQGNTDTSNSSSSNDNVVSGNYDAYVVGTMYSYGDQVQNNGKVYQCEQPAWCSSNATFYYEPGVGLAWESAWSLLGSASGESSGNSNDNSDNSSDTGSDNSDNSDNNTDTNDNSNENSNTETDNDTDSSNTSGENVPANFELIGYIDGSPLLNAGIVVSLRVFDTYGSDLATYNMAISNDGDDWLTPLAKLVNQTSTDIRIGVFNAEGQLLTSHEDGVLKVYSINGFANDFEIDLLVDSGSDDNNNESSVNVGTETENVNTTVSFTGNLGAVMMLLVGLLGFARRK